VHPSRSGEIRREFDLAEGASIDLGDLVPPTVTLAWVEGVVRDETGRALGGVRVEPRYAQGGAADEPGWSAPDGTWRVRAPQVAGLRLALTKRGRARTVVAPAPPGTQTVVSMQREGKVLVRIPRRPSGSLVTWFLRTPADGSKINAPERGAPRDRGDWRSWVFEEVPPGAVEVVLRLSDGEIVRRVNVIGGETVEVVF
jgi:hypothetical protein